MKPIQPPMNVPEGWSRVVFAEHQKEYLPLPALYENGSLGHAITCWRLDWRERIKLFFTGNLWLTLMTFHKPLQPILATVNQPELVVEQTSE